MIERFRPTPDTEKRGEGVTLQIEMPAPEQLRANLRALTELGGAHDDPVLAETIEQIAEMKLSPILVAGVISLIAERFGIKPNVNRRDFRRRIAAALTPNHETQERILAPLGITPDVERKNVTPTKTSKIEQPASALEDFIKRVFREYQDLEKKGFNRDAVAAFISQWNPISMTTETDAETFNSKLVPDSRAITSAKIWVVLPDRQADEGCAVLGPWAISNNAYQLDNMNLQYETRGIFGHQPRRGAPTAVLNPAQVRRRRPSNGEFTIVSKGSIEYSR